VRHASSQLAIAVQAGPHREVQLAVAVRGEQRIRTQLTQLTIPVVQGLNYSVESTPAGTKFCLREDLVTDFFPFCQKKCRMIDADDFLI
jgi:hypothetical protein